MSSLLPLIVLSIALLHCAQAVLECEILDTIYGPDNGKSYSSDKTDLPCAGRCYVELSREDLPRELYKISFQCDTSANPKSLFNEKYLTLTNIEEKRTSAKFLCEKDKKCDLSDLFDSSGDDAQKFRVEQAKKIGLKVERDPSGKVAFKWNEVYAPAHCMMWKYELSLNGNKNHLVGLEKYQLCPGVCYTKVTRIEGAEKKIEMEAGCDENPEEPARTECECKTILEDLTSRCVCPAKKVPLNRKMALFDPTPQANEKKKYRNGNLRKIGIIFEYKPSSDKSNEGVGEFKYDENYETTTTEETTTTVSGGTTVSPATTARPPSALPEDDPYYEELLGSATGMSLTFAVLLSILRLI